MDRLHVAVGVILDSERRILLSRRPEGVHQGGLWEFPGGKVEAGESVHAALARELQEELAIEVTRSEALTLIEHDYGDKAVCLDVHVVLGFAGTPEGREGQPLQWVTAAELDGYDFPAANAPITTAIRAYLARQLR